ncbi:MAG: hypothetical protein SF182_16455 [Deltaproteobacteria bacterium]|nr:hypothetical protein [Deltaproteobacteria bacterium]
MAAAAHPAAAQLDQTQFRAADGTAYQVLRNLGGAALRVTTVGGSIAGAASCASAGTTSGDPLAALGGAALPATLHPFDLVRRSHRLTPNLIAALAFDTGAGGRLTLGSGGGALTVCASPIDCAGAVNLQPLVGLSSNAGGVAGACTADVLQAPCDGTNQRQAFAFGIAASGLQFVCDDAGDATVATVVCAPPPSDGFDLTPGEAIVFVYGGDLQASSFAAAAGGFSLAASAQNPFGCAAGAVVGASADSDSQPTAPTPTSTPVIEPTRPAIPLIVSPLSPAGALLIVALGFALWAALRTRSATRP